MQILMPVDSGGMHQALLLVTLVIHQVILVVTISMQKTPVLEVIMMYGYGLQL